VTDSFNRESRQSGMLDGERRQDALARPQRCEDARRVATQVDPNMSAAGTSTSPATNRGELEATAIADEVDVRLVMADDGEIKYVAVRVPSNGQVAVIDGLRFVIGEETFRHKVDGVDDEAFVRACSAKLEEIFGFGLTQNLNQRRDFYSETWELGENAGYAGFGGQRQRQTILVALSGKGTLAAKPGWEARLHAFLTTEAKRPVITRCDVAHDCFAGEVTVDQLDAMHTDGFFTNAYTIPQCHHAGNWKFPNGKGRTLYVGTRMAGKIFRGYEKGKEKGDPDSDWVRLEVELSNKAMLIPFEILLDPSAYFMGAYPKAFAHLALLATPQRLDIKRKTSELTVDASVKMVSRQVGRYVGVLADLYGAEAFVAMVRDKQGRWPERLKVPDHELADVPIHRRKRNTPFNEFQLDPSEWSGALDSVVLPHHGDQHAIYH